MAKTCRVNKEFGVTVRFILNVCCINIEYMQLDQGLALISNFV